MVRLEARREVGKRGAVVKTSRTAARPFLDKKVRVSYKSHMSVLTIRLTEEEKSRVVKEARKAGLSTGAYVREKLNRRPIDTAADLLRELDGMMGDRRFKVRRRR